MEEETLEKRAKEKLVEIQDSIPRIHEELSDFIKLAKNIDVYRYSLDPRENEILDVFYPSVFTMLKPGIRFIEDFNLPTSSLLKTLALVLSGKFTDKELFTMMDKWIVPYYNKDTREGKPSTELLRVQLLTFLQALKEFMTRRIHMVRLLSDTSGIDAVKLQASKERGPVSLLIQFLAWHLYKNQNELRALLILSQLEQHISHIRENNAMARASHANVSATDLVGALAEAKAAKEVTDRLTMFIMDLQSQFALQIHQEKLMRIGDSDKMKKDLEEKERLAKEAANELLRNEEEEKKAKATSKKSKSKKKPTTPPLNLPVLPASAAPTPMASPPVAPSPSPPVAPAPSPPVAPAPSPSPPPFNMNALLRIPVFIPAPPVGLENPVVERFWTTLNQEAILRLLQKIQGSLGIVGKKIRFYVKGSAAISLYYKLFRGPDARPHTSDYDCTLLVDPSLPKEEFYRVRTQAMNTMVSQLVKFVNGPGINDYLTKYIRSLGIPFATSVYNPVTQMREYTEVSEPPVISMNIDEKMVPTYLPAGIGPREGLPSQSFALRGYFRNSENTYKYGELKETTSPMVLNLRILRTLKEPKNITILSLYLKTNPEIHLVDIAVPFHNYPGPPTYLADAQMSLPDQWANSTNNSLIQGISVLSLESLYKEQKLLLKRPIKNEILIDERLAYIQNVLVPNYIEQEKLYVASLHKITTF